MNVLRWVLGLVCVLRLGFLGGVLKKGVRLVFGESILEEVVLNLILGMGIWGVR